MRHFVLICYDITDDRRLRRIFTLLQGYGEHVQYSVFLCQLTEKDMVVLSEKIKDIVNQKEDQVILIRLGPVGSKSDSVPRGWQVIGAPISISDHSLMIY